MATTLSLTETYDGKLAGDILIPAFQSLDSLQYLTVRPNVEYKTIVRRIVDTVSPAALTCDFSPTGETTIDERTLTLLGLQVQRQYCKIDFLDDWSAGYAQDNEMDPTIANGIADVLIAGVLANVETMIWQGTTSATSIEGFIPLMLADVTVNAVASPEAITAANVLAKVALLIAELPHAVKSSTEKPLLYFSQDVWDDYIAAQVGAGFATYLTAGPEVPKTYMGLYQIVVAPGMPVNTMVFAQKSNLWFGTWKEAQMNQIAILDMADKDLSRNIRMSITYFLGVQYGWGNEIALYTTMIDS